MRSATISIGDKFTDKNGFECEVVEYRSAQKIQVRYEDGYTQYRSAFQLRKPFIKGLQADSLKSNRRKPSPINKSLKSKHYAMVKRLYWDRDNIKNLSYSDSKLHTDWLDYTNFKAWAITEIGHEFSDWHIDKDILKKGNKEYGPDTCCFVPLRINILFTSRLASRGNCPLGVTQDPKSGRYKASCRDGKRKVHLGSHATPEDAFNVYKDFKENLIKSVAEEYKSVIAPKVYEALLNYKIEITD